MKYVNPEYVSIIVASEDVITTSMDRVVVKQTEHLTQYEDVYYNTDDMSVEKKETTIILGLGALGI